VRPDVTRDTDLLVALPPDVRRALLQRAEHRVYRSGHVLVEQGSVLHSLFRIHSGFVRVHHEQLGLRVEIARMESGAATICREAGTGRVMWRS
jgi:hypothetical protein